MKKWLLLIISLLALIPAFPAGANDSLSNQVNTERYILSTNPSFYLPLWKKDNGAAPTITTDDVHGYTATFTGTTWTQQGRQFNGTSDKIALPTIPALNSATNFTIIIWYKRNALGNSRVLCEQGTDNFPNVKIVTAREAFGGVIYMYIGDAGAAYDNYFTQVDVVGMWYQVAMVYNGTLTGDLNRLKAFLNGIQQTMTVGDAGIPAVTQDMSATTFKIGVNAAGTGAYLDGMIGEVEIYPRTLSPIEVQRNYLMTKWRYQ